MHFDATSVAQNSTYLVISIPAYRQHLMPYRRLWGRFMLPIGPAFENAVRHQRFDPCFGICNGSAAKYVHVLCGRPPSEFLGIRPVKVQPNKYGTNIRSCANFGKNPVNLCDRWSAVAQCIWSYAFFVCVAKKVFVQLNDWRRIGMNITQTFQFMGLPDLVWVKVDHFSIKA